ncbi:high affinity zinc ion transporter [Myriangium duriaei CBS 260.36]|uniref:High affinity zinc ion transporter n=1 Tax=Myriangium duriaei CBS 260.36 TaxID=1168546 RepID=A0A9P4IVV8_9PEZI|nr:high affinity zinc ion transporter [Myriangium duriaei CBS 260.36]
MSASASDFDPTSANLTELSQAQIACYFALSGNDYNGRLGERIAALFVILIISTLVTFFPVVAKRVKWVKIPLYVYLFARYFGAGVIVATAFIHLLDPAYGEIGPDTCVGLTGNWSVYSWPPAIVLLSVTVIFLMDVGAQRYVEMRYGCGEEQNLEDLVTGRSHHNGHHEPGPGIPASALDASDMDVLRGQEISKKDDDRTSESASYDDEKVQAMETNAFRQQIAAFLILEFGVIFHSVVIGMNLGVVGDEFSTLFPVLVFHQSFEGLGIGARMSAIPFPRGSWLPWILCTAYGLTTPIAIAIGLGLRTTYNPNSFTANVVSGLFDSVSAGILIYTGLVELLARDFLFDPLRTKDNKRLVFMLVCVILGMALMALLGKWA